ncbi:MAG TPA: glycosyltransferase family 2 protein [Acidobacteriaceae bacterium]|nr:glycosyltransferase family 2 protein [Acidobacteriaceae bacterium]
MTEHEPMKSSDRPVLSICIPTYNRADCLDNCLGSLERAIRRCNDQIEIVVSDNASTDRTQDVVDAWKALLPIRYVRNAANIGGERNFFSAASHAKAEYVWIFGDDDDFEEFAVEEILRYVGMGYDVILSNYSSWSKDMEQMITSNVMGRGYEEAYDDPDVILSTFGILLGYISSMVVRKNILFSASPSEYEVFVPYGFPFPFCVYCGMRKGARMAFIKTPMFRRRDYNGGFDGPDEAMRWLKFFSEGPALVFEALGRKGYSRAAIRGAKNRTLSDFGIANILSRIDHIDRRSIRSMMYRHYQSSWRYWTVWLPLLVLPTRTIGLALRAYRCLRGGRSVP